MEKFEVHILGCGSAKPTLRHLPTSQVVNIREKLFMIDCGEGAQLQFFRSRQKFMKLNSVFISHVHGDHCFGLPGLVSTLNLLGRTANLNIFCPEGFSKLMSPFIAFFNNVMTYKVVFHEFSTSEPETIYDDRSLTVNTIPLRHRIPCCGFIFKEKQGLRHIKRDIIDAYNIPLSEICRIKNGMDYVCPDGDVIPNERLTSSPTPVRTYAYCSDTSFLPSIVEQIKNVDLLFHEATFQDEDQSRAKETYHSTASQAATIALAAKVKKLMIGHFSARYDNEDILLEQAKTVFPETILAKENMYVSV